MNNGDNDDDKILKLSKSTRKNVFEEVFVVGFHLVVLVRVCFEWFILFVSEWSTSDFFFFLYSRSVFPLFIGFFSFNYFLESVGVFLGGRDFHLQLFFSCYSLTIQLFIQMEPFEFI